MLALAQRVEDDRVGIDAGARSCPDDSPDAGEEIGTPFGPEAARDFPVAGGIGSTESDRSLRKGHPARAKRTGERAQLRLERWLVHRRINPLHVVAACPTGEPTCPSNSLYKSPSAQPTTIRGSSWTFPDARSITWVPGGFRAEGSQKDVVVSRNGCLRLRFPSRELARAYQDRVAALGYNELETKRFRIAPKPPFRLALKGRGKR